MSLAPSADEEQQRSDQIALHFYTKLFHVVYQARAFPGELLYQETKDRRPKIDRWFNLEIPDSDLFPRELREIYKSLSSILATANHLRPSPPLRIHVLLVVPESSNNQVLVTLSQSNTPQHKSTSRILIEPTPRYVLLETWKMQFTPNPDPAQLHPPTDVALPTIYKHAIPLFRSLYSLLRILPTWKLFKKLRRRTNSAAQFGIQLVATEGADDGYDERTGGGSVLGFDKPPTTGHPPLPTLTHVFPSIPHPLGSFTLSTTYLESPTFQLDDLESLLSSKFISLDEGGFVPTLSSATTTATSNAPAVAPAATAAAAGYNPGNKQQRIQIHPRESSIADRFVIPSPSSSSSTNAGQGQGHFSHLRQPSLLHQHHRQRSDSYSSGNSPPSTTVPLPAALSRLRLESNQSSSSSTPHRPPPPSLLLLSPTTTSHSTSPSPTSKSPFSPPPLSSHTPPQNTIPLPSLPSLHSLHSLPSLHSLSSLPPISPSPSPTTTQAMPIKRPNTINPFKTNTLLSASGGGTSTSLGAGGQPGSAGSIHSIHSIYSHSGSIASLRHTNTASPLSREGRGGRDLSRSPPQHLQPLPFPTSGGGKVSSPTSSPGPTFQKLGASGFGSGSGQGTTGGTEIGPGIGMPGHRKRYSSSFTHRYTSSASVGSAGSGGSDGREGKGPEVIPISVPDSSSGVIGASGGSPARSTGSGGGGGSSSSPLARGMVDEKSNSRSSSFLGKRTEDDDISLFMQDIETRKPLSGRWRMEAGGGVSGEGTAHKRDRTDGTDGTDRTVRAQSGSSLASEGTMRDDRTVGGSDLGDEDEEGDEEEGDGDGDGEEMNHRYSHLNQPSPLSPRSRLNPSRYYYANPGTTTTTQHATPNTDTTASSSSARQNTSDFGSSSASPPGAIPTSQAEVELRLKKMNEAFLKSLAGLDDGWSGQGSASSVAGTSSTSAFQLRNRDG
ncbi:hypothetical protein M378DRAFT_857181, partial [Amanita muscaria Koide BX008]